MVIFGAGASYDSSDTFPPKVPESEEWRPPLADDLFQYRESFDRWVQEYRECVPIVPRLRRHAGTTLESEMDRLRNEARHEARTAVELKAVRYYLRRILWHCGDNWRVRTNGATNYVQLLREIRVWGSAHAGEAVRLVTFNYDTLIEDACQRVLDMPFASIGDYVSRTCKVFKPHGSVNWVHLVANAGPFNADRSVAEHEIIRLGGNLMLLPEFNVLPSSDGNPFDAAHSYPALALPVNTKVDFECPEDHIAQLKADVPAVTKLLVIGWRATEPHFLDFWKQPRLKSVPDKISKIAIVAGGVDAATQVQDQLRASKIEGRFLLSPSGFSRFVTGKEVDEFLAD
jgi:hypothetical protein